MIKRTICMGFAVVALAMLVACSEEESYGVGQGRIAPAVSLDGSMVGSRSRGGSEITAADLSLTLAKADGSFSQTWETLSSFPLDKNFSSGEYTVTAHYGNADDEGFDKPAYAGSQKIVVAAGKTTDVSLTATRSNAEVSIAYSDAFKGYVSSYSAAVTTSRGKIDFTPTESRSACIAPGRFTVNVSLTTPAGNSATFEVAARTAEAAHVYAVNVDLKSGSAGVATLVVSFDESVAHESISLDISDALIASALPSVQPVGFTPAMAVDVEEGQEYSSSVKMNLQAVAGIKSAVLATKSTSLLAQGWPASVDLANATEDERRRLSALGLKLVGLGNKVGELAVVDFRGVLGRLQSIPGDNSNSFTLTLKDNLSRVSEPLRLDVNVADITLAVKADESNVFANHAYVGLESVTGGNVSNVGAAKFFVREEGEKSFREAKYSTNGLYFHLEDLSPATTYYVKVKIGKDASRATVFTTESASQLPNSGMEDWYITSHYNWTREYPGVDENAIWGTQNLMTTSFTGNRYNTAYCNFSGTRRSDVRHSGDYAAVIETIGWGANAAGFNPKASRVTVGELYLGYYNTTTQVPVYGIDFASRPRAIEFFYKYEPRNAADYGRVWYKVLDAAGNVLAQSQSDIYRQDEYVRFSFDLSALHAPGMAKAASLQLGFYSSAYPNVVEEHGSNWLTTPPFGNLSNGRFTGSSLYVDDINLIY